MHSSVQEKLAGNFSKKGIRKLPQKAWVQIHGCFPVLSWIKNYNRKWIKGDIIAGITIALVIIPQALAYAKLAALPREYGLYSSFIGSLMYFIFGTSKDMVVGPTSVLSLSVAQISKPLEKYGLKIYEISVAQCFISGLLLLSIGFLKLGLVLQLIPHSTIIGFSSGASLVICIGQLAKTFGLKSVKDRGSIIDLISSYIKNFSEFSWRDFLVGLSSVSIILLLQKGPVLYKYIFKKEAGSKKRNILKVFEVMDLYKNIITVVIMTFVGFLVSLSNKDINRVGEFQKGLPKPNFPLSDITSNENFNSDLLKDLLSSSLILTVLGTLQHFSVSKSLEKKNKYKTIPNQEFISLGMSNFIGSFFKSTPVFGSWSKSMLNSNIGVKTPLSGLISGLLVIFYMQFLSPVFFYLPTSTSSSIVFMSLKQNILGYKTVLQMWKIDKIDCINFLITFFVTIFKDIKYGLISSIAFSLILLLFRICRPSWAILQQSTIPNDYVKYKFDKLFCDDFVIFKWNESLIYPNADYFKQKVLKCVKLLTETPVSKTAKNKLWNDNENYLTNKRRSLNNKLSREDVIDTANMPFLKALILDFSAVNMVDYTGLSILQELKHELEEYSGMKFDAEQFSFELHFVGCNESVVSSLTSAPGLLISENQENYKLCDDIINYSSNNHDPEAIVEIAVNANNMENNTLGTETLNNYMNAYNLHKSIPKAVYCINKNRI